MYFSPNTHTHTHNTHTTHTLTVHYLILTVRGNDAAFLECLI